MTLDDAVTLMNSQEPESIELVTTAMLHDQGLAIAVAHQLIATLAGQVSAMAQAFKHLEEAQRATMKILAQYGLGASQQTFPPNSLN